MRLPQDDLSLRPVRGAPSAAAPVSPEASAQPVYQADRILGALPGPRRAAAVAPSGPLAAIHQPLARAGSALEGAARFLTMPLTWTGDLIAPARRFVLDGVQALKDRIDGSIGQVPVLGSAVRFLTGFGSSVLNMLDGSIQFITRPVDAAKALGLVAWHLSGLVPLGPKMLYDLAVGGQSLSQSLAGSWGGVKQMGLAIFAGAIADVKNGNYAGALGRVTADVGTMVLSSVGAARALSWAGSLPRGSAIATRLVKTGLAIAHLRDAPIRAVARVFKRGLELLRRPKSQPQALAPKPPRKIDPKTVQDPRQIDGIATLDDMNGGPGRVAFNREDVLARFNRRMADMPAAQADHFQTLVKGATTHAERTMLHRAVAAGRSIDEVATFADDLRHVATGDFAKAAIKDQSLIQQLQALTPEERVLRISTLEGLQQHFTASCGPTTSQVLAGEYDPIFSFNGHRDPQRLVAGQARMLRQAQDVPVSRDPGLLERLKRKIKPVEVKGTLPEIRSNELNAKNLGVKFENVWLDPEKTYHLPFTKDPAARIQAVDELERLLRAGRPTEISVGRFNKQTLMREGGHAISAIDVRTLPNGVKQFLLHDPELRRATAWVDARHIIEGAHFGPAYEASHWVEQLQAYQRVHG